MASELLKNRALIQKLKEPKLPNVDFSLSTASFESTLPEPKPQELLDIQENVRIQRQQDTMNKARPFLMDESVDFIERENFDKGSKPTRFTDAQKAKIYKLTKEGKDVDFILEELKKEPDFPEFKSKKKNKPRERIIALINKNPDIPKKFKIIPTGQKGQNLTYQAYDELKKKVATLYKKQNVKNVSEIAKELYPEDDIVISQRKIRTLLKDAGVREIAEPTQKLKGTGKNFNESQKKTKFRKELSDAYIERKSTGNLEDKIEFHHADSKNLNSKILTSPNKVAYLPKEINQELKTRDAYISKLYDQRESLGPRPKNKEKLKIWKKEWDKINKAGNDFVTDPKSKGLLNFKVIDDVSGKVLDVGIDESKMIMRTPDPEIPNLYGEDDYLGNKPFKEMTRIEKDKFLSEGKKKYEAQKTLTALQELASGKNVGFDPILATKAGYQEFLKPAASIAKRGALTGLDIALSAGAGPIGLGVGALIETGQAMPELTKGNLKEAGRQTIIGSLLPESLVGSMRNDLLQLAETPEEKIGMQNFIDFQNDSDRYNKRLANYQYLSNNPFEAEGIDLESMKQGLIEQRADLESRRSKVYNPEMENIIVNLTQKLDEQNVKNLEGVLGSIVGRRGIKDRDDIQQDILRETVTGNEPTYGQLPVQMSPEEIDEIYESGIMGMANGGRIGFADGPKNPGRRAFLKLMGGIASLPVVGKLFKTAKPVVVPLKNTPTEMPAWFPDFINKVMFSSPGKKIDADLTEYEVPELPGIKVTRSDDGRIFVEGKNEYNEPYEIQYEPPGYELVDPKTGQSVKTPGNFEAVEGRHVAMGPEDYDVEAYYPEDLDEIAAGDIRAMEKFTTGKTSGTVKDAMGKDTGLKKGEYDLNMAQGRAEAEADIARDLDDYYED